MFPPFQIVHLGVGLSEVEDGSQRVVLYYSGPGSRGRTQEAASFKMGELTGRWARFTLTVQGSEVGGTGRVCELRGFGHGLSGRMLLRLLVTQVRLYMDCEEYHRVAFSRSLRPLTFDTGSGIFVGNAGGTGLARFVVGGIFVFVMTSCLPVLAVHSGLC